MASEKGISSYKQDPSGAQAGPWRTAACKGTGKAVCRASRPCQRQVRVVIGAGRAGQEFCWLRSHTAGHITHCHAQTCTCKSPSFGDHKQNSCKENSAHTKTEIRVSQHGFERPLPLITGQVKRGNPSDSSCCGLALSKELSCCTVYTDTTSLSPCHGSVW